MSLKIKPSITFVGFVIREPTNIFTLAREKETVLSVVPYNKDNCSSVLLMIGGAVMA